jgi:hypothetical protein
VLHPRYEPGYSGGTVASQDPRLAFTAAGAELERRTHRMISGKQRMHEPQCISAFCRIDATP